jgi:hypothetical protein
VKAKNRQSCRLHLPMTCLIAPGEELFIVLMYVLPLMVPILRFTEHIRNFRGSSVWKYIDTSNTVYGWRYIMFYIVI